MRLAVGAPSLLLSRLGRLGLLGLVLPLTSYAGQAGHGGQTARFFASPSEIVAFLLQQRPRVMAFGEYHQVEGGAKVPSAVKRFGEQMLGAIAPSASDLVLETWVTEGKCGATETKAVAQVEETIKRPEATEDELVTLLKRSKAAGVRPHILTLSCKEYQEIQPKDGEVDYVKLLGVVTDQLHRGINGALATAPQDKTVVVYGGALHNDLQPRKELAQFSFAKAVKKQVGGRYLEIDLYVPEYIAADKKITAEPWYPAWRKAQAAHPGATALVERGPSSYIVIFPITKGGSEPVAAPEQPDHR
jgi:hypothetical protein